MLGRVRTCSLNSLEVLEMERTPKLLKDDSLSIYEKTLLKLQEGSRRNVSLILEESMNTDTSPSMATNEASVAANGKGPDYASKDPSDGQPMIIAKEEPHRNLSVLYLFSRYKQPQNISSSDNGSMPMEDDCSSATTSESHNPQLQQGCIVKKPEFCDE